ncbi:hypothetical protein [uncultured Polaribacter sp.]|uniref:hypothetical protein n=1 Tax=uncultured Polaribacter sp. TaxID=174711 RepID=UPI0026342419|nr:hypothetical protein [uncultured Polaribacter sp.]
MFKKQFLFLSLFFIGFAIQSQSLTTDFRTKKYELKKDTLQFDSVPINPLKFKVLNALLKPINKEEYTVDFNNATLFINAKKYTTITLEYYKLPAFLTKVYTPYDERLIVPNSANTGQLYSLTTNKKTKEIKLFEGLETKGFIARGLTSGNNQNAVTNAALDLEISGKLSESITLKANIWDTNIPIQENGYSQNITDFDLIFVEMFHEDWRVRAGDLSLTNQESYFAPFVKQAAGLEVEANITDNLKVSASGAVVRGVFNRFTITGLEGNQGPYKIIGANNETNILIIGGSDKVFINGIQIERGADKDYTIDYNLGEITFNTTYPITNDMRIVIEFQFSDRNYTRFVTYESAKYTSEKLNISGFFYSENDAKNQPLQQVLTEEQKQILAAAGNDTTLMFAESAFVDTFDENKILYRKVQNGAVEIFENSVDENEELFFVNFINVGTNKGDYSLERSTAIGNIYRFVGVNNGNFSPITRLIPPTKSQIFMVKSDYDSQKKTKISSEVAVSNNDANLFSSIDDNTNSAVAAKVGWQQVLIDKKWKLTSDINHEFAHKNFRTLQRWETVEFNRNWNLLTNNATKNHFQTEFKLENKKQDFIQYRYNHLNYIDTYNGNKHELNAKMQLNNTAFFVDGSFLSNTSTLEENTFLVLRATAEQQLKKGWLGAFTNLETNSRKNNNSNNFVNTSHRFKEFETYFGIGDTAKVFAKIGFNYRDNDSIKNNTFTQINNRKTIYINSKLINKKNTNLSVFANYRFTENAFTEDEQSLNSRIVFTKNLFQNFLTLNTLYETSSGNIARQEFVYVQTEPGLGYYTWLDYNNDGIQDFDEFEIAEFQDQANYLRVPKPNLRFLATQRAKFRQSVNLNFKGWKSKTGLKKTLSYFTNESFLSAENEQRRIGNSFNFNPFNFKEDQLVGLNFSLRNSLFFNRNLQKYSTTYTFGNLRNKQQFLIGSQENNIKTHQLDFAHKFATFWLAEFMTKISENDLQTENFNNRNYFIEATEIQPRISFLHNNNNKLSAFYHYKNKKNTLADFETLIQQKFGIEYLFIKGAKNQITANANIFLNNFNGDTNTPVAYQMLEGLQDGQNYTWNLLLNRKLNNFLNLNLSYLGRKSENTKTIHTGSVQLRAIF